MNQLYTINVDLTEAEYAILMLGVTLAQGMLSNAKNENLASTGEELYQRLARAGISVGIQLPDGAY